MSNIPKVMTAVASFEYLPLTDPESFKDTEVEIPMVKENDVLIQVKAVSVNGIDRKVRSLQQNAQMKRACILGFDGAGVVIAKGELAAKFKVNEEVYFFCDIRCNGANAQYLVIDESFVAVKPKNLSFDEAAAMPWTMITAYECLMDRLSISEKDKGKSLLIINSAGGVGSIASQITKNLGLQVIGTASRPESEAWSKECGADFVINHKKDLVKQLEEIGVKHVDYILVNYDVYYYWEAVTTVVRPQGKICLLADTSKPVDLRLLKEKSVTLVYEMMMTRIKYNTNDKGRQQYFLEEATKLFESGKYKSTLYKTFAPLSAQELRKAHEMLENKTIIGKLVLRAEFTPSI